MIEVIKHGTKKQIECKKCGAILSYQDEDVHAEYWGHNVGMHGWDRYIICPDCNAKIVTEQSK